VIYIDLRKGFDSLCHMALLQTLMTVFKINNQIILLIFNYLTDRKYLIKIGKYISKGFIVNRGIGQGFVLGPTLFILYFNEVKNILRDCSYSIFADDLAIFVSGSNVQELIANASILLEQLDSWFKSKGLDMNHDKT